MRIRSSGVSTWGFLEVRVLQFGLPAFAWRIPGLKSETWGTHRLIQEVLTQTRKGLGIERMTANALGAHSTAPNLIQ